MGENERKSRRSWRRGAMLEIYEIVCTFDFCLSVKFSQLSIF